MATSNTPEPTAAPQPAADDDASDTPTAAEIQAFHAAMQSAEQAVADAVRNMGESRGA